VQRSGLFATPASTHTCCTPAFSPQPPKTQFLFFHDFEESQESSRLEALPPSILCVDCAEYSFPVDFFTPLRSSAKQLFPARDWLCFAESYLPPYYLQLFHLFLPFGGSRGTLFVIKNTYIGMMDDKNDTIEEIVSSSVTLVPESCFPRCYRSALQDILSVLGYSV